MDKVKRQVLLSCVGMLALVVVNAHATDTSYYRRYQQLTYQLEQDPHLILPQIEQFQLQVANADTKAKQMAAYLHLQACTALERDICTVHQAELLLDLPGQEESKPALMKLTVQLYYRLQRYSDVIRQGEHWLSMPSQTSLSDRAMIFTLQAKSFYQLQTLVSAQQSIEQALVLEVDESRYRFLLALLQQTKQLTAENTLLQLLTEKYINNPLYWERLAYSWYELDKPEQALNVFGSAYKSKLLPLRSLLFYSQLLIQQQAPNRAVRILEKEADKFTPQAVKYCSECDVSKYRQLLIQAYLMAERKSEALALLEKKVDKTDEQLMISSQLAYSQARWHLAIELLQLQIKQQPRNDYWRLLLAVSYFENKDYIHARKQFRLIKQSQYMKTAQDWLSQIDYLLS